MLNIKTKQNIKRNWIKVKIAYFRQSRISKQTVWNFFMTKTKKTVRKIDDKGLSKTFMYSIHCRRKAWRIIEELWERNPIVLYEYNKANQISKQEVAGWNIIRTYMTIY